MGAVSLKKIALVQNLLTSDRLDEARQHQRRHGGTLYDVLIENRFVDEEPTITAVAQVLNIPCVSLRDFQAEPVLVQLLPVELASLHRVVPLGIEESATGPQIFLAMANPIDVSALEELSEYTHRQVVAFLAGPLDIAQTLERLYGSAIYNARASLDALFGGTRTPARPQSFGPSVSQLLEMPMLPEEEESMRLESLQHVHDDFASSSATSNDGDFFMDMTHLGVEPLLAENGPRTAPLAEVDPLEDPIVSINDLLDDDELDLLLEGGEDSLLGDSFSLMEQLQQKKAPDKEGLFTVSASKIFMRPESLSQLGKHRAPSAPTPMAEETPEKTPPRVGLFRQLEKVTTEEELAHPMTRLEAPAPSVDVDPLHHFGFGPSSSFQQPREPTQRAAPALSMDALASQEHQSSPLSSLEASPALESYEELDLLRALVRALLKRGVISENDLHEAMREMTSPDSLL